MFKVKKDPAFFSLLHFSGHPSPTSLLLPMAHCPGIHPSGWPPVSQSPLLIYTNFCLFFLWSSFPFLWLSLSADS
jgi:hypothetical protein